MTHRFFVEREQLQGDQVHFTPAQAHQLRDVLRLRAGQEVRVFDGVVPRDRQIRLVDPHRGCLVGESPQAPEPRTHLTVYPTLLPRGKFELVLQKLTELGVAAIGPLITARSLVREATDERRVARWRAIVREASEQCGRGSLPALLPTQGLAQALASASGTRIVAFERERRHELRDALAGSADAVAVFVGPEGGFTPDEAECAERAGAQLITLGPRVLRADTAAPLLAGLVLYERGDLSWPEDLRG